jgi:NADP-dependent 3-hydroxy acid dehydrogenase YdfG
VRIGLIGAGNMARAMARGWGEPVLATDSGSGRAQALVQELGGSDRAVAVRTDVTRFEDNQALVTAATERFGRLDVAFANAGFGAARGWLEETPEHWRDMVLTNVLGAAYTLRAAIPALKASRGHALITGSVAGRKAMPGSLYSCTKWAVTAMGEAVRQDLNETGVRVTVIEPGGVETPFFDTPRDDRLEADDIARAVMYAVSQPPHVDVNEILIRPISQPH